MPDQKHVQRNVGPNKVHEKPKDFKKSMKKLLMWDKKLLPFYILAIIFAISGSICSIIGPNGLSNLTDTITEGVLTGINFDKIKSIGIFLLTVYVISGILTFLTGFIMATTANKLAKKLRTNISQKINKLPLRYYDTHSFGDVLSRVTNDVDTIGMSISHSLGTFVHAVALLLSSVVMMFYTNWMMALTAILTSLIGFIFMFLILSKSQKYFNERQVDLGNLNGHIEEMYSGYNVVKVYNGKKKSIETFKKLNEKLFNCSKKSQFLSGLMQPIMNFIGNLSYVVVCILGAVLVKNDVITFGVIVAFIVYVRLFTSPLQQIAQGLTNLQSAAAASERVFEFLEEENMPDESGKNKKLSSEVVKGNIEFEHVKFGYNSDKLIIKDFSAKAKSGQKIAIVGPTGAGKTTLVNLLMKFYEINSGDIKIEGVSINDLTRENVHDLFVMVLQDTWLFNGTIRENIVYNKENVSDEEVLKACKTVGLEHFIKSLPYGLDTVLMDNDSISAGQKQLLTIARAMIEDAPFLILDEATSNVDTRTEELVQKAMDKLTEGRTSFIIAHRLSTIKNADLILVINEGNIIEQGNHEELLAKNGFYADLYNSQFQKTEEIA
ncbi:MAG TPA: ABC transporter ATP-binding protein [Candidatus Scatovivens faecipullorum]|nr:ABC transporter ATP-binding protein [Candidatus Scatovivens faecipullorum]